ncbi:MAG: hypothetical protein Q8L15_07520 [Methylobacter sp.]|nr:hypothetical protein [Methylobacter sp.]
MFENILADTMRVHQTMLRHCQSGTFRPIDALRSLCKNVGLHALVVYRFGRWLSRVRKHRYGWAIAAPLYPAYWMSSVYVRKAYGINLDQSADIAPDFHITHFGGIEVRNCRIGPRCSIYQQVKLGSSEPTDRGLVIGEGVYIGPHAQICADVIIGDGVTVGAGAVVTQDIPSHCMVLGNPGRITLQDYDNSALL